MRQRISVDIVLSEGLYCKGCPLLSISANSDMIGECLGGYWADDEQFDIEASEAEGGLTYIRPQSCKDDNDVEA